MNREEMIEQARLIYDWNSLFTSLGFRKTESENLNDGAKLTVWERETSKGVVQFWATTEEKPAILAHGTESPKAKWEKFDIVMAFHAGGEWALVEQLMTSGDTILAGPLAEIASENRVRDLSLSAGLPREERLQSDPLFRKQFEKELMQISAREAATEAAALSKGNQLGNLFELDKEQIAEKTGLIDWQQLWADETPERWFVPNLLCEGRAHGCHAPSGIGKSLLWQDVAAGLASGRSVLGFAAQDPVRVLYLDHENTPKGDIKPRLLDMGYGPEDLENLIYLSFPSIESLNTKSGGMSLVELLDYFEPRLVFLDTFSRFVEGDENSSRVAQEFYDFSGRELKRRNIAYLRIDHVGKDASRGARGSSAKVDDLDLIWTMSKSKEEGVFILKNDKARVPIKTSELAIERRTDPLRHLVRSGIRWDELIATARKHEDAIALVEGLKAAEPEHSLAQGKVWHSLKTQCASKGIARRELYQALAFVKGEIDSEVFI